MCYLTLTLTRGACVCVCVCACVCMTCERVRGCVCVLQTRTNFEETSKQTESLMKKIMEVRQMVSVPTAASSCLSCR